MEHHALDGHLRLQRLHKMPCDRLTFAILISGEVEGVCLLQRAFQVGNGFLLVAVHDVIRLESVFDIHAELAVLGFLGRRLWLGWARSRIWPTDAMTVYPEPKYPPIFFALVGDSTITSLLPVAIATPYY